MNFNVLSVLVNYGYEIIICAEALSVSSFKQRAFNL